MKALDFLPDECEMELWNFDPADNNVLECKFWWKESERNSFGGGVWVSCGDVTRMGFEQPLKVQGEKPEM